MDGKECDGSSFFFNKRFSNNSIFMQLLENDLLRLAMLTDH
jgi:hypothetical protein